MLEPGRFRIPRNRHEAAHLAPDEVVRDLFPEDVTARLILTHTRPEPLLGTIRPLDTGHGRTVALGYVNAGGTLDVAGLLFRNRTTWGHAVREAAGLLDMPVTDLLSDDEIAALEGKRSAHDVIIPAPRRIG
jgi:phosphoketolase